MAGWFKKKINTLADYKGLKMRIPGLGGKVVAKAGGTVVLTPGGEIYAALERGGIDATEWVGPHDDMKLGLQNTARYYYYPGWHEPATTLEFVFNKKAYEALPVDLRRILDHAVMATQVYGLMEYEAKNAVALERLKTEFKGKVDILQLPVPVLRDLKKLTGEVIREESEKSPMAKKVYASFTKFHALVGGWRHISEGAVSPVRRGVRWCADRTTSAVKLHRAPNRWRRLELFCLAVAILLCAPPSPMEAQQARRPARIGVLNAAWAASHPTVEGLKAGLKELGFEDERDVTFEIRFTEGKLDAMPVAAAAFVKAGVDLIFTSQEAATRAAKDATKSVPIVFTLVGDPVESGIVSKLAQPGGNVTGVSSLQTELVAKRMEVLKRLTPSARRVWLIFDSVDLSTTPMIVKALAAAQRMKLEMLPKGVLDAHELKAVFREVRRGDAVLAPEGSNPELAIALIEQSLALRVPAIFGTALWVGHGGLMSYGPDYYAQGVQAAALVAKILRGARPQDLPVEGAEKIDLAVNLKTAELLGLTVPRKILLRADAFRR